MENQQVISGREDVVRLLSRYWVVDGTILHMAFSLREHETYISVNRPAVSSFDADVADFVSKHQDFKEDEKETFYYRADMNVDDIRKIHVCADETLLDIDVMVEPRDVFTKSHAGIFTRYGELNVKKGVAVFIKELEKEISSDEVLLEVRSRLLDLATLKTCIIPSVQQEIEKPVGRL